MLKTIVFFCNVTFGFTPTKILNHNYNLSKLEVQWTGDGSSPESYTFGSLHTVQMKRGEANCKRTFDLNFFHLFLNVETFQDTWTSDGDASISLLEKS